MIRNQKKRFSGITGKVTLYIALFTAVLLAVIWICLVFLLGKFYENEKIGELMQAADVIEANVGSDNIEDVIKNTASSGDVDILVAYVDGNKMKLEKAYSFSSILNNNSIVNYMINQAEEEGGACIRRADDDRRPAFESEKNESMIYCRVTETGEGKTCILASVVLTPVDATVNTIQKQLLVISVIFILLAIAFGLILSYNISRPIIDINKKAKCLGNGDYGVHFDGEGYREVHELADTLNTAAKDLSKVEELRRELIANISHDLRTPLTMITGYSEVMRDIPGENTPENMQVVIDEAQRLSRLVNDILSISKIEAGMDKAELSEFNITESVKNIIARYSKMKSCEGYSITFEAEESVNVCADEMKISQVVYNLLGNAVNYTGEEKTVRAVQTLEYQNGEKYVRFDVYDTGTGISEENIKYIWDRYYKENKTHKRSDVGTGLGLSIVKGVISLHGGRYGVVSEEGKGSDFWFSIKAI